MEKNHRKLFAPAICITQDCNLNCGYCYQKHKGGNRMSLETAKDCIDWIFSNIPDYAVDGVDICLIGGEPLFEFDLIKEIFSYAQNKHQNINYTFRATTNGTVLDDKMKKWFTAHNRKFKLGLSLDGAKETHDTNRNNSFDAIDFDFFLQNWLNHGVKMTLSEFSLSRLAENIKFIHYLGFKRIRGVNLAEGYFDWSNEEYIKILIPQFAELVSFYVKNDSLKLNQMFDKDLYICEATVRSRFKSCGVGVGTIFFNTDGKRYPCPLITPMTFCVDDLSDIECIDYSNKENFLDEKCFNECYIYPICRTCAGTNYLRNKTFKKRDKSRCRIEKLISLFIADLQAKRIAKNPKIYDDEKLYHTIEAIKKIRSLYLTEFEKYLI